MSVEDGEVDDFDSSDDDFAGDDEFDPADGLA